MHPGILLGTTIKQQGRTQKQFAFSVGKKVSELNELIKGKRNITIQRDYLLHNVLGTPLKYWVDLQRDYDYELFLSSLATTLPFEEEQTKQANPQEAMSFPQLQQGIVTPGIEATLGTEDHFLQEKKQIFRDF